MLTAPLAALALLTRVPVRRPFAKSDVAAASIFFPIVGAIVGGLQAAVVQLLAPITTPLLAAAVSLGVATLVTGGLHVDGLADVADGFGGGHSRVDALRIMRDPRIGSYGAAALIVVLLIRATAISALVERNAFRAALLLAPLLGRWTVVAIAAALPYARTDGGTGAIVDRIEPRHLLGATGVAAALSYVVARRMAVAGWTAALIAAALCGAASRRRIGGYTGDVLGAASELTETAALVAAVAVRC